MPGGRVTDSCTNMPSVTQNGQDAVRAADPAARVSMSSFWEQHSTNADEKEMMLDDSAELLGQEEIPEVLSYLPNLDNKDVLELGAGIGRFTGKVAEKARTILAMDFMESFCKKNQEINGHLPNVKIKQGDVTELELEPNSMDVVFSNWLLMYLTDEEVFELLQKILTWLRPGGHLFFRESCFHPSGNKKRAANPTRYRSPTNYCDLIVAAQQVSDDKTYSYSILSQKAVQTYIKYKTNRDQLCWLMEKVSSDSNPHMGYKTFQEFLDQKQYSRNGILRYEKIFGRHFVSTGGRETTEEFVKMLNLKKGDKVYDVGCGIGGSAFLMAEDYGAHVLGIDLSSNMINIALERLNEVKVPNVAFEVCDATTREFPEASFDVVYSRDTILHIEDKKSLFERFLYCLKPGGRLLISDYCCSEGEHSDVFKAYVADRGYHLLSPAAYGKVIESAGFVNVKAEDRTDQFTDVLKTEVTRTESIKDEFIQEFSLKDYDDIVDGWKSKLERVGMGNQRWGLFYAEKPQ